MLGMAVGCSRGGPEFAAAGGLVTLDGTPVSGAGVMFTPRGGGPVASATTDETGHFSLRTLSNDGALVGEHQVSVTKGRTIEKKVPKAMMPLLQFVSDLPERYARRETSGLTAQVTLDETVNEFSFTLLSR